jgi:hypothetical protein
MLKVNKEEDWNQDLNNVKSTPKEVDLYAF